MKENLKYLWHAIKLFPWFYALLSFLSFINTITYFSYALLYHIEKTHMYDGTQIQLTILKHNTIISLILGIIFLLLTIFSLYKLYKKIW